MLLAPLQPFLLRTDDSPEGVDRGVFDGIQEAIVADRFAYFKDFSDNFCNVDVLGGSRISEQAWRNSFTVAAGSSTHAAYACVRTWLTDLRADGNADRVLPIEATADRLPDFVKDLKSVTIDGGPHVTAVHWRPVSPCFSPLRPGAERTSSACWNREEGPGGCAGCGSMR